MNYFKIIDEKITCKLDNNLGIPLCYYVNTSIVPKYNLYNNIEEIKLIDDKLYNNIINYKKNKKKITRKNIKRDKKKKSSRRRK